MPHRLCRLWRLQCCSIGGTTSKIAHSREESRPPFNTWFLGPILWVRAPKTASRSVQHSVSPTHRHTQTTLRATSIDLIETRNVEWMLHDDSMANFTHDFTGFTHHINRWRFILNPSHGGQIILRNHRRPRDG